ncbi:MAG: glycosyltransferase family 2 protein [Flavobacteriales bacterium]
MNKQSLISVVVPCYNQAQYLEECLQSVLNQTYDNWECIIVNDGSPDNTEEVAKKWVEKDSRFKYLYKENGGLSSARNAALGICAGEWVLFLDADDIILPHKIENSLKNSLGSNVVVSNFSMINNEGVIKESSTDIAKYGITLENIVRRWDIDFSIPIHCALMRKDFISNTRFNESVKAKEDWIFWIDNFSKKQVKVIFFDEKLVLYRQHAGGMSKNYKNMYVVEKQVNLLLYNDYSNNVKQNLYERLNEQNFQLKNIGLYQKNKIENVLNIKVLKIYFKLKSILYNVKSKSIRK